LPGVRAWVVPGGGAGEPGEEVPPARGVDFLLPQGKAAVDQSQAGARRSRGEDELDFGRAGRHGRIAGHAPADQHATGRVDLQVLAPDRHAVDVDLEGPAGDRLEGGVLAHPADHRGRVGQVPEDLLGRCGQVNLGGEHFSHRRLSRWLARHLGRPARR
jgi:hypothetical protein